MELYSIGKFAKLIGVTEQTLRNWDKQDKLKPASISPGGSRYYSSNQYEEFIYAKSDSTRKIIGFCRVDCKNQLTELDKQVETMTNYIKSKNKPFGIITAIGTSYDYDRKGFRDLFKTLCNKEVSTLVIYQKDSGISNFGQSLFRQMLMQLGTRIEIIDLDGSQSQGLK